MIGGIIDQKALSIYQDDLKEIFNIATDESEANLDFLQSRFKVLDNQVTDLSEKRECLKNELKAIIFKYKGELSTIDQMLKYMLKEQGACEIKLKELKGEI